MSENRIFYQLKPATMDPCSLIKAARANATRTWQCEGGNHPRPETKAIGVQIEESRIKDKPLNLVTDGIGLALKSFLDQLGRDIVDRDLFLGRVFGPDGESLDDWVTFRGRRRVIVRGTKEAGYRRCEVCDRVLYFAMGKEYLYPSPPSDADIFESDLSLVVRDFIFARLEIPKKAKIYVDRLEVLDVPPDGLGVLE